MSKRKPLSILIASLFLATPAVAQNVNWQDPLTQYLPVGWITEGEITIAPIYSDIDSKDPSKLLEYRDLAPALAEQRRCGESADPRTDYGGIVGLIEPSRAVTAPGGVSP